MNKRYQKNWNKAGILFAAAVCLAGCGAKDADTAGQEPVQSSETQIQESGTADTEVQNEPAADLRSVYDSVGEAVTLPSMVEGDDDYISNYYGIDPADLEEYVFAEAEDATLASCVIMMKAKDAEAAGRVETALNTVLNQKAAEMQDYIPEQYDIVTDSAVKTNGLYVYLVISEDKSDIESVIASALK